MENKSKSQLLKNSLELAFIEKSLPFMHEVYNRCKNAYDKIDTANMTQVHKLPSMTLSIMTDMKVLSKNFEGKSSLYKWTGQSPSVELSKKIYKEISATKTLKNINKRLNDKFFNKNKKFVPIAGTKRVAVRPDTSILRSLTVVYTACKESDQSRDLLLQLLKGEVSNDATAIALIDAFIETNFIVGVNAGITLDLQIFKYSWNKEFSEPSENDVKTINAYLKQNLEIKSMEKITVETKILSFLNYLYENCMSYIKIPLYTKAEEFGLTTNVTLAVRKEFLSTENGKVKWNKPEEPNTIMVNTLIEACRAYSRITAKRAYDKKHNKSSTKVIPIEQVAAKTNIVIPEPVLDNSIDSVIVTLSKEKEQLTKTQENISAKLDAAIALKIAQENYARTLNSTSTVVEKIVVQRKSSSEKRTKILEFLKTNGESSFKTVLNLAHPNIKYTDPEYKRFVAFLYNMKINNVIQQNDNNKLYSIVEQK